MQLEKHSNQNASPTLPQGFFYVGQDNYLIVNLNDFNPERKYLYSDSATSCIIVVVEGKDAENNPIVALTHLSRTVRFQKFFDIVAEAFRGPVSVFAQGGNPPQPTYKDGKYSYTSLQNEQTLINWINANIQQKSDGSGTWYINQSTLSLGQGNPQVDNRGCYGIDLTTMEVSNQEYTLTELQRDPTGGVQTLFCVFGLDIPADQVPILQPAAQTFSKEQIELLVARANDNNWTDILYMTQDEVLQKYSSTPEYEAPWFFDSLRLSAEFVKKYNAEKGV